jgi:hypothetical protein
MSGGGKPSLRWATPFRCQDFCGVILAATVIVGGLLAFHVFATMQLQNWTMNYMVIGGDLILVLAAISVWLFELTKSKQSKIAVVITTMILLIVSRLLVLAAFAWKFNTTSVPSNDDPKTPGKLDALGAQYPEGVKPDLGFIWAAVIVEAIEALTIFVIGICTLECICRNKEVDPLIN